MMLAGYVSGDCLAITDAHGRALATVTARRRCKLPRWSWVHGQSMESIWARDASGRKFYGRGSPMIAIRMRQIGGAP